MKLPSKLAGLGLFLMLVLSACSTADTEEVTYEIGDEAKISLRTIVPSSISLGQDVPLSFSITNETSSQLSVAGRTLPYWFEVFDSDGNLVWKHFRGQLDISTVYSLVPGETITVDDPWPWDQTDTTQDLADIGQSGKTMPQGDYTVQVVLEIGLVVDKPDSTAEYQFYRTPLSQLELVP